MRQPPPPEARLGLYGHGDTVSEQMALELLARPDFVEEWVIAYAEVIRQGGLAAAGTLRWRYPAPSGSSVASVHLARSPIPLPS